MASRPPAAVNEGGALLRAVPEVRLHGHLFGMDAEMQVIFMILYHMYVREIEF